MAGKEQSEIFSELEKLLSNSGQITFFNISVDNAEEYYDAFGPDQYEKAADTLMKSLKGVIPHMILCEQMKPKKDNSDDYGIYALIVSDSEEKKDPLIVGESIKNKIESVVVPKTNLGMMPKKYNINGTELIIDPEKIKVHIGISVHEGANPDIYRLMEKAFVAERKSQEQPSKIYWER